MFKKLICLFSMAILLSTVSPQRIQAETFSLRPIQDTYVSNDTQSGPDATHGGDDGIHIRNIASRRRVGYIKYDISEIKKAGRVFSNVSLSNLGWDGGDINVYGLVEALDSVDVDALTWNTAPGVKNNPVPTLDASVELDYDDLTEQLVPTFRSPARNTRESTEVSQALTDFLNSDIDGIIVLVFAPAAAGDSGIILSMNESEESGTLLEGEIAGLPTSAYDQNPANEAVDVPRDVTLSWTPGGHADTHNVYIGTVFDDVNTASIDNQMGVQVSIGLAESVYNPGRLDLGKTYYWRVDEVNAPPDTTTFKGPTWSFTVEPIAYPIPGNNITATASSSSANMGPEKTIDESGLTEDRHSTASADMWQSSDTGTQPTWIKYEFDKVYKLYEMWVWNSNQSIESLFGFGLRDVTIEYSLDDSSWTQLANVPEFNQATGLDDYTYNTTVDFNGVVAKYIRITANSNWGGLLTQYGLSEVRFFYIPARARLPQPASEATGVALDAILTWRQGRYAVSHEVYFGSDMGTVENNIALADTVSDNSFALSLLELELGSIYYWKVNEVNEADVPSVWEGDTWSFTTADYRVVDNFEDYDDVCNRIYYSWQDGLNYTADPDCGVAPYAGNGTGSIVGSSSAPFAEQTIVHEGGQSMPFEYDNTAAPYYSETQRQWASEGDWTKGGANSLTVWFYGQEGNSTAEQLYVAVEDSAGNIQVVNYAEPAAIQTASWQEWNIPFTSFADVNMAAVKKMYIGVGNRTAPTAGGKGKIYIDDIRLYP